MKEYEIHDTEAAMESAMDDLVGDIIDEDLQSIKLSKKADDVEADEFTALQEKYEATLDVNSNLEAQMLRLQADFDNFRKRTKLEKAGYKDYVVADLADGLLGVLDNFTHAVKGIENDEALKGHLSGIVMIYKQLKDALVGFGIEEIDVLNADFDPQIHQAVSFEAVDDDELDGKVLSQFQAGYRVGDKLVRPAIVTVGKKN